MDILIRMLMAVLKDRKHKKQRRVLSTVLAAVVVFMTTYSLILPAITLEESTAETTDGIFLESADVSEADPADDDVDPSGELLLTDDAREESAPASDGWEDGLIEDADWEENGELADIPDEPALTDTGDETEEAAETETGNVYAETEEATEDTTESEESVGEGETESELEEQYPEVELSDSTQYTQVKVYAPEGAFPEGTQMLLSDVEDDETIAAICDAALAENSLVQKVHAVDISFRNSRNEEIEPLLPIRVEMTAEKCAEVGSSSVSSSVVHVDDSGNATIVENAQKVEAEAEDEKDADKLEDVETIAFEAKEFSVYALVYTVDFHWEVDGQMYEFSLPGGGFISFSDLIEVLGVAKTGENDDVYLPGEVPGINDQDATGENGSAALTLDGVVVSEKTREFVADVKSVVFSSPELVDVSKVESETTVGGIKESRGLDVQYSAELTEEQIAEINAQTVVAGDWALISVQPFESTESLTVTMKTGEVFEIRVTDAQLKKTVKTASGETWEITITYDDSAEIPKDAELRVEEILPEDERYEQYYQQSLEKISVGEVPDTIEDESGSEMIDETAETASEEAATTTSYAHIFDIQIWAGDQQIEPASGSTVSVSIKLLDAPENEDTNLQVVHFGKDGLEVMELAENNDETKAGGTELNFVTDEFSVYAIIGTETFTDKFLTEDGETYNISVTAGAEAHIPADAHLEISEVKEGSDKYDELFAKAQAAVTDGKDASVPFARFFDIAIVKDGEKIQPDAPVDVKISFDETVEANKNAVFNAVHIADDGENVDVLDVETEGEESDEAVTVNAVQFEAEGFSIYGVTYTVDFETVDGGKYSIPGEGSYKLNDLLPYIIGVEGVVSDAKLDLVEGEYVEGALYLTQDEAGDWFINSDVPFDDTYLLSMVVDGVKYVLTVTDENTSSADLSNFITKASINADKEGNTYVLKPGKTYSASLTFKEDPDGYQFDDSGVLTYTLPDGFTPEGLNGGTFPITATSHGENYLVEGNRYEVVGNQLKVYLNTDSPNYQYVSSSPLTTLNVNISGTFNQSKTQIDWGGDVKTDIKFDTDAGVSVQKSITNFDAATGIVTYSVSIKALNGPSSNIVVTDHMNGNHVSINHDVTLTGAQMSSEGVSYTVVDWNQNTTDFSFTIPSMNAGQEATVTYTAQLKDGYDVAWEGGNTFTATPGDDHEPDNDSTDLSHYIQKPYITKSSSVSDVVNGKQTITWTIEATSDDFLSLAGQTIKDTIAPDSRADMHYSGNGLTIKVTYANGNSTIRYPSWQSVGVTNKNSDYSWTYNVPSDDTGDLTYLITYTTEVDVSNMASDVVVKNNVEDKYSSSEGKGTVGPEGDDHKATIDKSVQDVTSETISWKVELEVPVQGLTIAKLTDYLPANTEKGFYDSLDGSIEDIEIEGLDTENERVIRNYNAPDSVNKKPGEVIFNFQKKDNNGNWVDGLNGGSTLRKISLIITSKNDASWMTAAETEAYLKEHKNTAKFQANNYEIEDSDEGTPMKSSLDKNLTYSGNDNGLPVYYYNIKLTGVTGPFTIDDTFDERLELFGTPTLKGGNQYNQDKQGTNPSIAVDTSTDGKVTFTISDDNLAKQGTGYYSHYLLEYALKVKDADALASIKADAAATSNGIKKLRNTATSTLGEDYVDVDYKYTGLTKELVNESAVGADPPEGTNICNFKITVNPDGLDMNPDGDTITLKDVFSKTLSIDYRSISVVPGEGASWNVSGYETTFILPDETPLVITYNARIVGDGKINFYNEASIGGQKVKYEDTKTVTADMGGTSENYNVKILKHKRNELSTPLAGAIFELYRVDEVKEGDTVVSVTQTAVTGNDGNKVTFRTNSSGLAFVEGNQTDDGWSLHPGQKYYLWEITAPDGYTLKNADERTKYYFTIAEDDIADYDNQIYHNGDTLHIANTPLGGIEIRKSFRGASLSDDEKNKITFTITGPEGYSKTVKLSEFTNGKSYKITGLPIGDYTVVESNADIDGYTRTTSYYVGTGSTEEGESATVTLSNATEEKVINYINKYQSDVEINPDDIQLRVQKKWFEGDEDKTSSGDYDDKSVEVQVVRYRAVMPTTTLHFMNDGGTEEISNPVSVPKGADVTISVENATNIGAMNCAHTMWTNDDSVKIKAHSYGTSYTFSTGTYTDVYVNFQGNPGKITMSSTGGTTSVADDQFTLETTTYTGPTATLTNGTWSKLFPNLPTTGDEGTTKYIYKYAVREISEIDGFDTTYSVDGGDFKKTISNTDAVGGSGSHSITIKNKSEKGSLKLTKEVKVNGDDPTTDDKKALVNGEYTFTVTGPGTETTVNKTVVITIAGGTVSSATIDGTPTTLVNGYVVIPELNAGDYTITETGKNGLTLASVTRGDNSTSAVDVENSKVTVTVVAGDTSAAQDTAQATFTNNINTGDLSIKKGTSGTTTADANDVFTFNVVLTKPANVTLASTYAAEKKNSNGTAYETPTSVSVDNNGNVTTEIKLKANETFTIKGLPAGTGYTVTETAATGYTTSIPNNTSTIANSANSTVTVTATNTRDKGSLNIQKTGTVNSNPDTTGLVNGTYKFTVAGKTNTATAGISKEYTITLTNGVATKVTPTDADSDGVAASISDGKVTVSDLPTGFYIVSEDTTGLDAKGISLVDSNDIELEVTKDNDTSIPTAEFKNNMVVGSLKITKIAKVGDADASTLADSRKSLADGTYTFNVYSAYTDEQTKTPATKANGEAVGDVTVEIENGTIKSVAEVKDLLPGTYYVKETSGTNTAVTLDTTVYEVTVEGGKTGNTVESTATATATNTLPVGSLEVTKAILRTGNQQQFPPEGTYSYSITITTTINNQTYYVQDTSGTLGTEAPATSLTVTAGTTAGEAGAPLTISNLPYGRYTVTEVDPEGVAIANYSYTVVDESVSTGETTVNANKGEVALKNYYVQGASWTPEVTKLLNGNAYADNAEGYNGYTFVLTEDRDMNPGQDTIKPHQGQNHTLTAFTGDDGVAVFDTIKYEQHDLGGNTASKDFYYTITEQRLNGAQNDPYIANDVKYDTKTIYVKVTVKREGHGKDEVMSVEHRYYSDPNYGTELTNYSPSFDNTELGTLTVQKTVTGSYTATNDDTFPFTVKKGDKYVTATADGNTYTYTELSDTDPGYTVKDGETITFKNLPVGTYVVTEGDASRDGYTVTTTYDVASTEPTEPTEQASAVVTKGNTTAVEITNKYRDAELKVTKTIAGITDDTKLADAISKISFKIEDVTEGEVTKTPEITATITASDLSEGKYVKTFTSAANGIKPDHKYKVTETVTAPDGYTLKSTTYEVSAGTADENNDARSTVGSLTLSNEDTSKGQIDFTNTYSELVDVDVTKAWKNADNTDTAPENASITLSLYAGATEEAAAESTTVIKTITLDGTVDENGESTAWKATFSDLPKYDTDGTTELVYIVKETDDQDGYTVKYSEDGTATYVKTNGTVTNEQEEVSLSGTKTWVDGEDENRPDSLEIKLFTVTGTAPNETEQEVTLQKTDSTAAYYLQWTKPATGATVQNVWSYTITHLPKYASDGTTPIKYRVKETVPTGYKAENNGVADGTVGSDGNITNANLVNTELTEFKFKKVWQKSGDSPDQEQDWPEDVNSITVIFERKAASGATPDGTNSVTYTVTKDDIDGTDFTGSTSQPTEAEDGYTYEIISLPKYFVRGEDVIEWKYSIRENQVEGYTAPKYFTKVTSGSNTETEQHPAENVSVEAGADGSVKIVNQLIMVTLPQTGGIGTKPIYLLGTLITLGSAILLIMRRRRGLV